MNTIVNIVVAKAKRGMATKAEDAICQLIPASTHDYLLFFTNRGRVFRLKAYEVPAANLIDQRCRSS